MAYRIIVLELVDDPLIDARIEAGRALAQRFAAELVGIHGSMPPFVPVGYGDGAAYVGPEVFEAQREIGRRLGLDGPVPEGGRSLAARRQEGGLMDLFPKADDRSPRGVRRAA